MPDIFDLLGIFGFLSGWPAAIIVVVTAALLVILRDWRWLLLILIFQYLAAGLLYTDVLEPRSAFVKILVGLFVCLILTVTAGQVNWGRLPSDLTEAEARRLGRRNELHLGPVRLPSDMPFRILVALVVALGAWGLTQGPAFRLPVVPDYFNLAVFGLVGLGLVNASLTAEPMTAGIGLLTLLTGFELFYGALEQSAAMMAVLAVANLSLAVAVAYLTRARHDFAALLEQIE